MTCALLALALLQSPDLSVKVDVAIPATRAVIALQELSKISGVKLETSPVIQNEVLIIQAKQATLKDLMDRIAIVSSGAWKEEAGSFRLVADTDRQTKERLQFLADQQAKLQKVLKTLQDDLQGKKAQAPPAEDPSESVEMSAPIRADNPPSRALARAVLSLGQRVIGEIPLGQRAVFSNRPTRMQRALPGGAGILSQLVQENRAAAQGVKTGPAAGNVEEMEEAQIEAYAKPPVKLILAISRSSQTLKTEASLTVYDSDGNSIDSQEQILVGDSARRFSVVGEEEQPDPATPPVLDVAVAFGGESEDLAKVIGSFEMFSEGTEAPTLTPRLNAALDTPTKFDPLRFFVSDSLAAIAAKDGVPLVACVPDAGINMLSDLGSGKVAVEKARKSLLDSGNMKIEKKDGWLMVQPAMPFVSRATRADRSALERLVQGSKTTLFPRLEDLGAYALTSAQPGENDTSLLYFVFRVPGVIGLLMNEDSGGWNFLRLFGTLTMAQRQAIRQGQPLPISSFTPVQQGIVNQIVYGPGASLDVETEGEAKSPLPGEMADFFTGTMMEMGMGSLMRGRGGNYLSEPTESLPSGLPGSAYLQATVESSPAVVSDGMGAMSLMLGSMSAKQIGYFSAMGDSQAGGFMGAMGIKFDKLRLGQRTQYRFRLALSPQISVKETLVDNLFPRTGPLYTLETLPADMKKAIEDSKKKAKEMMQQMGEGMEGGEGPPPPR